MRDANYTGHLTETGDHMRVHRLTLLPVALVLLLSVIAPTFMEPMFRKPPALLGQPAGLFILGFGGLMMGIGFILIRRIVDIEV